MSTILFANVLGILLLDIILLKHLAVEGLISVTIDAAQNPSSLSVWNMANTGLVDLKCEDTVSGDAITCTCRVKATNPASGPFNVQQNTGDKYPKVYYTGTGLTKTIVSYTVTVLCEKTALPSETGVSVDVTVNVIANRPPFFKIYPAVTATSVDARKSKVGDTVHTMKATDPEFNTVNYTMTQSPDTGFFDINAATGVITINKDLKTTTVSTYSLTVLPCDFKDCGKKQIVYVPITNLNTAPKFSNLPSTISLSESASGGTVIETLTAIDAEGDAVDTTCSVNPVDEAFKFVYETNTQRLKLLTLPASQKDYHLLDYDKGTTKYIITCVASDGYQSSQSTVTINVKNVNEAPVFPQNPYYCYLEESKAGGSRCTLNLGVTDPDNNLPTTTTPFTLLSGNHSERFAYVSDQLTFAVNYDVDNNAMPLSTVLTIQAKDVEGLTATSKIYVTVADVNDNECQFTNPIQSSTINQGTALGNIGSFVATDADVTSPNNDVRYESAGGDTNYMAVFSGGQVRYSQRIPESEHGRTFYLHVRCVDGGSPSKSSTATYALTFVTTTTTTTSTPAPTTTPSTTSTRASTSSSNLFDNSTFVAVFATFMTLLGLALLALLTYCCCCRGPSVQRDRDPLTRVKPYRDDYGREDYRRGDYNYSQSRGGSDLGNRDFSRYSREISYGPVSPSGVRALPASRY